MAKIFINTSAYEGFPNTFIQAFKNKTPVISLNVNPDNILTNYQIGLSCANNFEILKQNLQLLIENNSLYQLISKDALKYAIENHNIKKIAKNWQLFIQKLIN